jgi:Icc-related predicted phosphoesterase
MIKLMHVSDMHGRYTMLEQAEGQEFDAWCITGDFFPNKGRGMSGINAAEEAKHQIAWFGHKEGSIFRRLGNKPVITVDGNHDFVSLGSLLQRARPGMVHRITPAGLDFMDARFAGFPNVPFIRGHWNHESGKDVLSALCYDTFEEGDPEVLVTHCPPYGILDEVEGYGCTALTNNLTQRSHRVRAHLFGHCHVDGGKEVEKMGIKFYNGAEHVKLVVV